MQRQHKIAIARILADLIKADRIIDAGEMDCWSRVCGKYGIDRETETAAQGMSFAEALGAICSGGDAALRDGLLADCRSVAVSDGFCAHSEALIMITLMLALDPDRPLRAEAISIPKAGFDIDVATALYVESEYDAPVNAAIQGAYRAIFKELQLAGFHFVYSPKIIEHYRNTDPALMRRILSFLAPQLSEGGIENACRQLMDMTTAVFCKDLLCNKCGITELRGTYPSLLIKIGNSFVGESSYANYLKIEVDENILASVEAFVDRFCSMLSGDVYVVNTTEERDSRFQFHGFYKQLLDIFLIRKNIRSTILIDPYKEEIFFPEIDTRATGLHRRERALYALLLCCGKDGLNFRQPRGADSLAAYDRRIARIQARYRAIYTMFGGDAESVPDLGVPEIRRPIFSCLRRSLRSLTGLYNPDDYNVTKSRDDIFSVNIESDMVRVARLDSDTPVPLTESELYRRFAGA